MSDIDTADQVVHKPTGERHTVACVHDGYIYTCGNPSKSLGIEACQITFKASHDDLLALLRSMAAVQSGQHRPVCARARLITLGADVAAYDVGCC